jgi:hypothetical protein
MMPTTQDQNLLDALLDSWDRNNTILVNLLHALPENGLEAKAMEGSPSVAQMFMHMHYVRLVFIAEDAPEYARKLPEGEWRSERDRSRIAAMLNESAKAVREAVKGRLESGREMDLHYDHPSCRRYRRYPGFILKVEAWMSFLGYDSIRPGPSESLSIPIPWRLHVRE